MKHLLLFFLSLFSYPLYSQYATIHLSGSEGMSNSSVNCLFEDSENILWLGTWDGLNSYNGRDVKTYRYNKKNEYSISNNIIRQIIEEDSVHIWTVTDKGINRLNKRTQKFSRFFEGRGGFIMTMMADKTPLCYIHNDGLYHYDTEKQLFEKADHGIGSNVNNMAVDSYNNLYVLYRNGVLKKYRLNKEERRIRVRHEIIVETNPEIATIFLTPHQLIINYTSFLKIINTRTYEEYKIDIFEEKKINNIACKEDIIYIHYHNNEFAKYDIRNKKLSPINEIPNQLPVFSMYAGLQNILWIGSDGQGVIGVHEYTSPFKTVRMDAIVRCFAEEGDKYIWIGTKGDGIKLVNKETGQIKKTITRKDGLVSNSVYTIKKNKSGDMFVGADGNKINIISPQHTLSHLIIPEGLPVPENIYSILFTHDSLMWVGTSGNGFYKINIQKRNNQYLAKSITRYQHGNAPNSLSGNSIYAIEKDKTYPDVLWIGIRGGGVNRFEISTDKFTDAESLGTDIALSGNDVLCLYKSRENNLWIGTSYGLNRLTDQAPYRSKDYSEHTEFVNNTIHGILEDNKGNMWISTNHGLLFLDPHTEKIIRYTVENGLQSNEFADGAFFKGKDSILYFGGVKGFSCFDAGNIRLRSYSPSISLSNLQINNVTQNIYERIWNNTLNLSYNEPYLTLTFIANDFINNKNCEYSYRIKGFAEEWIYNEKQPNIILTKLPSGKYELEVKCTNGDGVWGDNVYTLKLNIAYPWWKSNLAYAAYIFVFSGIGFIVISIIKNRIKLSRQLLLEQLEKEHQERIHESKLNFFTNVAHEFFTPLTLIYAPSQLLAERTETDDYSKKYLRIIKNNADRMQKLINELMEFRKIESGYMTLYPEEVNVRQLIEYIIDNYTEIIKINNINPEVQWGPVSGFVTDKASLDKILFNLISNAFKYTPPGEQILIRVEQDKEENSLIFLIKNKGVGLTSKQMTDIFNRFKIFEVSKVKNSTATGVGLNLTKNLVELLGGTISVRSVETEYVEFKVILPSLQPSPDVKKAPSPNTMANSKTVTAKGSLSERKKKISILIVEDEKDIRELLRDILSPYYSITEAGDGIQGLAEVESNMPDIIITDILMPNMDGINFMEHLKSNLKTAHIPIISISAKNTIEDHINAFKHGADLYIEKPFNPYHVLTTVENIIDKFSILQQYFNSGRSAVKIKEGVEIYNEEEKFIRDVIVFIENNMDNESLNPMAMSEYLNISKTALYEKLKKITGKTPGEFIRVIRLEHASKLLKTTQLTTSEIIYRTGFSSRSYFYREFAKYFNMSPQEFRIADKQPRV